MQLALYETSWCGYCARVRRVIAELGLAVESRDVDDDHAHFSALQAARGRTTVPVLRISAGETDSAEDRWMPESADIIAFLRANAATLPRR